MFVMGKHADFDYLSLPSRIQLCTYQGITGRSINVNVYVCVCMCSRQFPFWQQVSISSIFHVHNLQSLQCSNSMSGIFYYVWFRRAKFKYPYHCTLQLTFRIATHSNIVFVFKWRFQQYFLLHLVITEENNDVQWWQTTNDKKFKIVSNCELKTPWSCSITIKVCRFWASNSQLLLNYVIPRLYKDSWYAVGSAHSYWMPSTCAPVFVHIHINIRSAPNFPFCSLLLFLFLFLLLPRP